MNHREARWACPRFLKRTAISGMNTLTDRARSAACADGPIVIEMQSGARLRFPAALNPRLARGTAEQLANMELSPFGIHWPDLDEDLSFRGIAEGDYGQPRPRRSGESSQGSAS